MGCGEHQAEGARGGSVQLQLQLRVMAEPESYMIRPRRQWMPESHPRAACVWLPERPRTKSRTQRGTCRFHNRRSRCTSRSRLSASNRTAWARSKHSSRTGAVFFCLFRLLLRAKGKTRARRVLASTRTRTTRRRARRMGHGDAARARAARADTPHGSTAQTGHTFRTLYGGNAPRQYPPP